jgi:pectate lyase
MKNEIQIRRNSENINIWIDDTTMKHTIPTRENANNGSQNITQKTKTKWRKHAHPNNKSLS